MNYDGGMTFHGGTCRNTAGHDGICRVTRRGMTGHAEGAGVTWCDMA